MILIQTTRVAERLKQIQWLEWGRDCFETARNTGKPILLDITGSWCHWCHVMDNTSYSDPGIVDMVNKSFIPIRVDTDKRPDVNRRYNMGGWPTTVFLDADGKIITGGTYIPPQQLKEVIRSVLEHHSKHKGNLRSRLEPHRLPKATDEPLTDRVIKDIATSVAVSFDIDYGGFGFEPKFPQTDALEYALVRYRFNDEKEMLTVVNRTLEKMGKGGIYDQVEDGFFRYSTTRDWSIPHFEKMAEDNAKILGVYLRAYLTTGNGFYREIAEGIIRYVDAKLSDRERGGYFGSQDADEEYYKLDLKARSQAKPPRIDKTFYTNYNAHFISSYLLASQALERPELGKFALMSLDRMLAEAWQTDGLLHYWGSENSDVQGLLLDHSSAIHSLLDGYEHSGKGTYLERAVQIADLSLKTLHDAQNWGFFDIPEAGAQVGELRARDKPMDENSVMASALVRLSHVTSDYSYADSAGKTLKIFAGDFERYGLQAAGYALALDTFLNGPVGISIVGQRKSKEFNSFRKEALRVYPARRSILYLNPSKNAEKIRKLGYDPSSEVTAYVCVGKVCGPPLKDPFLVKDSVTSLLKATVPPAPA